jgi:hypothetical protein
VVAVFTAVTKDHIGLVLVISTVGAGSVVNRKSSGGKYGGGVVPGSAMVVEGRQVWVVIGTSCGGC